MPTVSDRALCLCGCWPYSSYQVEFYSALGIGTDPPLLVDKTNSTHTQQFQEINPSYPSFQVDFLTQLKNSKFIPGMSPYLW